LKGSNNMVVENFPPIEPNMKVNNYCRVQIGEWFYRVTDYFDLDREIVFISMSYLDRFLGYNELDRKTYKLAATTSLLLSIKLHCPHCINISNIINDLTRGDFTKEDIENMEMTMLQKLSWKVHPSTPINFVTRMLMLHPFLMQPVSEFNAKAVKDFAKYLLELSVLDYYFALQKPSHMALAAILNGLERLDLWQHPENPQRQTLGSLNSSLFHIAIGRKQKTRSSISRFIKTLAIVIDCKHNCEEVTNIRVRLWDLLSKSNESNRVQSMDETTETRKGSIKKRSTKAYSRPSDNEKSKKKATASSHKYNTSPSCISMVQQSQLRRRDSS